MAATQVKINVPGNHLMVGLLGTQDELLRLVETAFPERDRARARQRDHRRRRARRAGRPAVRGARHAAAARPCRSSRPAWRAASTWSKPTSALRRCLTAEVLRSARGRSIRPKSSGQKRYIDAIRKNVVTFGIGPAGTGKSWLAVAMAVQALQSKDVERIILTRPAVEAGERLGFLPGDLMAKVDPYLRPLYDALYDMVEPDGAQRLLERGTVEVAPLAFMRGRTLNDSFIILDEAQNTTPEQMKMFLTRIGFNSRVVVTGDMTQVDVQGGRSGLGRARAGARRYRRTRLRAPHEPRRGAPPDRAGHRRRLRPSPRTLERGRAPVAGRGERSPSRVRRPAVGRVRRRVDRSALTVLVADEQNREHLPVDAQRWTALARARAGRAGASRATPSSSVSFVDEAAMAELNERFMGARRPDRRPGFPHRRRRASVARRRRPDRPDGPDDLPLLLGDVVICPASRPATPRQHAGTYEDEIALLLVHGVLHVLGHGPRRRRGRAWRCKPRTRAAGRTPRAAGSRSMELSVRPVLPHAHRRRRGHDRHDRRPVADLDRTWPWPRRR